MKRTKIKKVVYSMKVNRRYLPKTPPRHEFTKFTSQLLAVSRLKNELLPHSIDFEVVLRDLMIEVSADGKPPLYLGCMYTDDRSMDKIFAESLADDIREHLTAISKC